MISFKSTIEKKYKIEIELNENDLIKIHSDLKAALKMDIGDGSKTRVIQYPGHIEDLINAFSVFGK